MAEIEWLSKYMQDRERPMNIFKWCLAFLSIAGVVLNVLKNPIGFVIWMFTNASWAVIDFKAGIPQQGCLFVVYFVLSVWGFSVWMHWFGF